LTAALLAGVSLPGGFGKAVIAQDGAGEFHAAWPYTEQPNGHFNVFVVDGILANPNIYGDMIWQPFGLFNWGSKEWMPLMATSWGFIKRDTDATPGAASPVSETPRGAIGPVEEGADTFQIRLRQGAMWSDGSEFTSRDVLATLAVQRLMSNVVWKYLDRVEAPDPYTVNFVMKQPSTVPRTA